VWWRRSCGLEGKLQVVDDHVHDLINQDVATGIPFEEAA
jgi:hypothetical protein